MAENRLIGELDNLRKRGVAMPQSNARAALQAHSMHELAKDPGSLRATVSDVVRSDQASPEVQRILEENRALTSAMGNKRNVSSRLQRVSSMGGSAVGGDVYAAIPRFYDPMEYWDLSGLPWNMANEGHRHKLHKWLRLYYATHYLIPILVDIFTRFPLVGMDLESKDPQIKAFYEDLFFNQLDYENFLVSLGREFWVVGEAFPLASFDEDLAVWEREELLNPEQVTVEQFQLLGTQQLKVKPPDELKRLVQTKSPAKEYRQLEINFPELKPYLLKGENIPISNVLLKQVANLANDWDDHGTPILLRGLRTLLHEEKLMASQDAIAERLYSPLILAKLGIMDLADGQGPWIPGPEELEAVRDDFDIALASDFRLIVHHFGLDISSVFGREQMPRLGDDFDRIERRLMQVFGVNPSLLSAGASTQPYASSALQAEFLNQILRTFQKALKDHFRKRALVVAEAQGHQDYEVKGQTRIPLFEKYVEFDLEGNKTVKERPKLLIPEMKFATLDLRDEATERQFLQSLRQMGVPIPDQKLMVGIDWEIRDEIKQYNDEIKEKTISQQQAKMDTYQALVARGLPVPPDLAAEIATVTAQQAAAQGGAPGAIPGGPGPAAAGPGGPIVMPPEPGGIGGSGAPGTGLGPGPGTAGPDAAPGGGPPPVSPISGPAGTVPEVSNERRPGLTYNPTASTKTADDATIDEPESTEFTLKPNQELIEEDGEERIVENRFGKIKLTEDKSKKYSIVDPDAESIELDEENEDKEPSESSENTESPRRRAASKPGNGSNGKPKSKQRSDRQASE